MRQQSMFFKARVGEKLADLKLQANLRSAKDKFVNMRASAVRDYNQGGDFEALCTAGEDIHKRVVDHLDTWLELFEQNATARGATVLWAKDGQEICDLVVGVARQHGISKAIKSKSMLSEEADLNRALEAAGIQPVETDLGEYILQIAGNEAPSHIIAPVMHKNLDEIADLFARTHSKPRKTDIPALTREAREVLRAHFLSAGMGITGGNFLIAETGSVALVTNEGNGRMVTTLPKVHVVITCLENALDLPHASTLCQQCSSVCPVKITLPELLRKLREKQTGQGLCPPGERLAIKAWAWLARRPALYALATRIGVRYLVWLADGRHRIEVLGMAPAWTTGRAFPAPQGRTFRELYREAKRSNPNKRA